MTGAQELVLDASLLVAIPVAALAGLLSFFTPCTLPLVPGYLSYVAGVAGSDGRGTDPSHGSGPVAPSARRRTVAGAALFVLGFAVVFTSYGALFGGLGGRLVEHQELIIRVGGVITIVLGVLFTGIAGRLPCSSGR
ncbi:cytochrome c biogenesis CcdA family protein [Nocardioides zeae]